MSLVSTRSLGAVCLAFTVACLSGCGSDSGGSTTGKTIVLHGQLSADPVIKSEFTTGFGWDVALTQAKVSVSALYYFDGPPPTASFRAPHRSLRERVSTFFIASAWAHPGHYQSGTALGQTILSKPIAFDLLSRRPVDMNDGVGVTGVYRSARFVFPETPPDDAVLDGHLAVAEGKAIDHEDASRKPIYFRLIADEDDIAMDVNERAIDGCVLDETTVTGDGTISVVVNPTVWLDLVDFSKIDAGTAKEPTEARSRGFSQGLTQLSAYHFSYKQ